MSKVKEIEERFNRGYTNTIYGNRYGIHKQMNEDIEALLIICTSSLKLPTNKEMVLEIDKELENITEKFPNINKNSFSSGFRYCFRWLKHLEKSQR